MSTRRPLANVPNATNSPRRAPLLTGKRTHPGISQNEGGYYYGPPLKKQALDNGDTTARTQFQKPISQAQDSKLFARKSNAPTTAFEKKLAAARDKGDQSVQSSFKLAKDVKTGMTTADIESVRMWQKYYRKVFPTFVFYFESIPDDSRYKASRQVAALGAVSLFNSLSLHFAWVTLRFTSLFLSILRSLQCGPFSRCSNWPFTIARGEVFL